MVIKLKSHLPTVFIIMLLIQVGLMALGEGILTSRLNKVSGLALTISALSFVLVYAIFLFELNKLNLPHKAEIGSISSVVFWVLWLVVFMVFMFDFLKGNYSATYASGGAFQLVRGNLIYQVKAILLVVILKFLKDKKLFLFFLFSSVFFVVDGRRWLMLFSSITLIAFGKFRFTTTLRNGSILGPIFLLLFLLLSTVWDQMRNASVDGSNIFNTLFNAFENRWSMFYFNSEVIEYMLENRKTAYGVLTLIELNNSLPGPIKVLPYVDTDILIERTLSIGANDFPTNIISFLIFDFGLVFGIIFSPLLLLLPFKLTLLSRKSLCKVFLYSYSLVVLASIEFQFVTYFILIRDIVLILLIERFILLLSYIKPRRMIKEVQK